MHGFIYQQSESTGASAGWREKSDYFRARRRRCRCNGCVRREPSHAQKRTVRHFKRFMHDELPCAAGSALASKNRRGQWPDDHGARLYQRPGAERCLHADLRRARSATQSMIPTKTGAAAAVGLVLPELNGKLDGFAIRVPTLNVSMVDLSFIAARETSVDEVNAIMREAADSGPLQGILAINALPLVSVDFNHHPASSIFDATLTKVSGRLVKVSSWYDNEWGFSNRMLDVAVAFARAK